MKKNLYWVGVVLSGAAAILSVVSTNMNAGGIPADVHPVGAIGVGVAAIAFIYASKSAPE